MNRTHLFFAVAITLAVGIASQSQAAQTSCNAFATIPGGFISGNCVNGNCTANVFGTHFSTSGTCSDGSSFFSEANTNGGLVQGHCVNGQLSANLPGGTLMWTGNCANGGSFQANPSFLPGSYIFSSCRENGSFSASIPAGSVNLNAECSTTNSELTED